MKVMLTGIIEKDGDGYVALCPELNLASQGDTAEEARMNLMEAMESFLENAPPEEIKKRLESVADSTHISTTIH